MKTGGTQPSLTSSASWLRTLASLMTMLRGDKVILYSIYLVLYIFFQQFSSRLIKVVKDRIRTVHEEDRLQELIVWVAALRKRCSGHKASNFNNRKLQTAVRRVLQI